MVDRPRDGPAGGAAEIWDVSRFVAAVVIVSGLVAACAVFWGEANPDWGNYEAIYEDGGGYLQEQGRDPLFTLVLATSRVVLGRGGYLAFRLVVFTIILLSALWLAMRVPAQRTWRTVLITVPSRPPRRLLVRSSALVVAICVVAVFLTKATVQIREGLAFVLIAAAASRIARRSAVPPRNWATYALLGGAALIHNGTAAYVLAFAGAHVSTRVRALRLERARQAYRWLAAMALLAAVAAGAFAQSAAGPLQEGLEQMGITASSESEASAVKYAFWLAQGVLVLCVASQLRRTAERIGAVVSRRFFLFHAGFVMPFLYFLGLYMVATAQPLPIISLVARMIATAFGIALLTLLVRRRTTPVIFLTAVFLVVDQVRVIFASFV